MRPPAIPDYPQDNAKVSCFETQNQATNRQVIIFDSTDGSFDGSELDNKALDRKPTPKMTPAFTLIIRKNPFCKMILDTD